ncbi:MAG: phosphoribosylaminoimidazolesuccinocarboxamide synthase [Actinobacteria bacterium]|nr:phosphoribosylaminoimidazolesuccinocarboxamide synthase [Actinomycetota bacterium]
MANWNLPADYQHLHSGKVRDLYLTPKNTILLVASDRISAFDYVLPNLILNKGKILTAISLFWFNQLSVPNHVISNQVPNVVDGRAIEVMRLNMLPIECVVRKYLTGSAWLEYQKTGQVCGLKLPVGLSNGSKLAEPIFTPATKADLGKHDENIDFEKVVELIGSDLAKQVKNESIKIFNQASKLLERAGFTLIDTKFEFGLNDLGELVLADEVLTPDSSRICNAVEMKVGELPSSFDKQLVRNWLLANWEKDSGLPPPELPNNIIELTGNRYQEVLNRLLESVNK